ncbi:MAG TPA: AAA family ATPase [Smithella sp.]|nr:AAA family ATPase [Smithella sp.]
MKKIVVSSMRSNSGKTSIIAGIISLMKDKKFAYAKPLGDRLIYRKKRSWDYDASLMVNLLGRQGELESHYEKITLGFDRSRLKYMYDEEGMERALAEIVTDIGGKNDVLFIESGKDLTSGAYLNLDAVSVTKSIDGKLLIVVSGDDDCVLDDLKFIEKYVKLEGVDFGGVIINKISDLEEFENACTPLISKMGIAVVGVIPYQAQLTYFPLDFLADKLLARVLAGEDRLKNIARTIIIGTPATLVTDKQRIPARPELSGEGQLLITGGDRSDQILAALERDTAGIILTDDIVPHQNIISRANERGIPVLLVGTDTLKTAGMIENMEPLLRIQDTGKISLLSQLIEKHTNMAEFLK